MYQTGSELGFRHQTEMDSNLCLMLFTSHETLGNALGLFVHL